MLRRESFEALMKIVVQKVPSCFVAAAIPFFTWGISTFQILRDSVSKPHRLTWKKGKMFFKALQTFP
jgi:hypothetical protein